MKVFDYSTREQRIDKGQLTLGRLIAHLKTLSLTDIVNAPAHPHSYRGYYDELAFSGRSKVTVRAALYHMEELIGAHFTGYKGGDFFMSEATPLWWANYGEVDAQFILVSDLTVCTAPEVEALPKEPYQWTWSEDRPPTGKIEIIIYRGDAEFICTPDFWKGSDQANHPDPFYWIPYIAGLEVPECPVPPTVPTEDAELYLLARNIEGQGIRERMELIRTYSKSFAAQERRTAKNL